MRSNRGAANWLTVDGHDGVTFDSGLIFGGPPSSTFSTTAILRCSSPSELDFAQWVCASARQAHLGLALERPEPSGAVCAAVHDVLPWTMLFVPCSQVEGTGLLCL